MKTEKIFAFLTVVLAPCLATIAQPTNAPAPSATATAVATAPAEAPPAPAPSTPADTLAKPTETVVAAHGTAEEPSPTESASLTNGATGDEVSSEITLYDLALTDAVKALALKANLNIQIDPKLMNTVGPDGHLIPIVQPNVDVKWKNVTARQALSALLDNYGWQLVTNSFVPIGTIKVKDPKALEPLATTVVQLNYSNPTNIIAEIQSTLSPRSSIVSDPRTHNLIVRTTIEEMKGALDLITKLDIATRQVLIEAKVVETSKAITSAKGVDWTKTLAAQNVTFGNGNTAVTSTAGTTTATALPTTTTSTSPGGAPITTTSGGGLQTTINNVTSAISSFPTANGGGGFSLSTAKGLNPATAFLNADGLSAVLSFLNTDGDLKSINFPRTVALDGVQTVLSVVQNIPIFEQQQSAPAAGAAQGLETVIPNYDKVVGGTIMNEVGTKLTVIARIAGPTNVLLDLRPELSSVFGATNQTLNGSVSTAPIFARRSIVTQASVPSTYTLVLGGLESDTDTKSYTKVPFLGDMPGIGLLFRSDNKSRSRDTILIFVTPTIIQDADFQPGNSQFLKTKSVSPTDVEPPAWDTGKPYDWTKPKPAALPTYQP